MQLHALTAIAEGAEVLISYIEEEGAEREERQAMLRDYGFICQCERCEADDLADRLATADLTAWLSAVCKEPYMTCVEGAKRFSSTSTSL